MIFGFISAGLVAAYVPSSLVDFCLWKPHGGGGLADFSSAFRTALSAAVPRKVQHCNSCITENLGAVSPVFLSLCEKPFMIQNLFYRCSLDKLTVYIVQESDMKESDKNTSLFPPPLCSYAWHLSA